jgi:hypothetical protein
MVELSEQCVCVLEAIVGWARARPDVRGVALVGSHARGTARPDSDIDVAMLTATRAALRADKSWIDAIEWSITGAQLANWGDEDYGVVWSRHVTLGSGTEVEISVTPVSWAANTPPDADIRRVISDGCRVFYDPDGMLERLCKAVGS